jgi:hypothetical protein
MCLLLGKNWGLYPTSAITSNLTCLIETCTELSLSFWPSYQSTHLHIQSSRVRFPELPDFLKSSWSESGSTPLREGN